MRTAALIAALGVALSACVAQPPAGAPSATQRAAVERLVVSVVSTDGKQATGILIGPEWMLLVRHRLSRMLAENMDGLGVDVRGTVVTEGVGDLDEDEWYCPSLAVRLAKAAPDWRLVRLATPVQRGAEDPVPVSTVVHEGDRVVMGGFVPRSSGPSVSLARLHDPNLWCSLGIVTDVGPSGAFAVVLVDEGHQPGCSGSPVMRLDANGEPEALIGIFTGDYKGFAFPHIIQSYAACAPIAPEVERLVHEQRTAGPSGKDGESTLQSTR
jgi:hypothetical protein